MRRIALLLLGVAVGAAGAASIVNALRQRDAYPRGLMDVMQHHYAALRDDARRGRCENSASHVSLLHELSGEIGDAVYGDDVPDSPFREFQSRLREELTAPASVDCRALQPQLQKIGATCDDCHRQYR
jgi:cytochrome c556